MTFIPVEPTGSYEDWGKLVLSWALSQATPPGSAFSDDSTWRFVFTPGQPKTIGGTDGVIFPDSVQEVVFVRDTATRRYVRLPDPAMATAAQQEIKDGADYELPEFYLDPPINADQPDTVEQKIRLQAERVGDYSVGSCM
jgi:hypothetical protein